MGVITQLADQIEALTSKQTLTAKQTHKLQILAFSAAHMLRQFQAAEDARNTTAKASE